MQSELEYIAIFNEHEAILRSSCDNLMNEPRSAAIASLKRSGFPSTGQESYTDCNIQEKLNMDFGLNINRVHIPADPYEVFKCDVPNLSTKLFFVVNDQYIPSEKAITLPDGVLCGSLNEFSKTHEALLKPYYNGLSASSEDGMVAFNTSFVQDGVLLYIPANVHIEKPIQIIQVLRAPEDMLFHRRVLVVLEAGASARLLFCDHSLSPVNFLANQVAELYIGDEARLEYYELEMNHQYTTKVTNTFASLKSGANLLLNGVTLSNGFTRNNVNIRFNGENAETFLSGIVLGENNQFTDNHIFVDHAKPHCKSNQLFKYVIDDTAKAIFAGTILVEKDAQKTEAYQSNKNLCARTARMNAKPQLLIFADDVKCSHGSATGQMDENALFYMRARGISEPEARLLLKYAFTSDVIEKISLEPLRDRMRMLVEKRFRGELARCAGCTVSSCS
jgi:Fe-S cluster assembly protein SufD